jgi:hypothetical protein
LSLHNKEIVKQALSNQFKSYKVAEEILNKAKNTKVSLENAKTLIPYKDLKIDYLRSENDTPFSNIDKSHNNSIISD